MRVYYDLHIHSCLSPCGDNDMTPNNIVNMSLLNGMDMIALTDHNSCKNCRAAVRACVPSGILPCARRRPISSAACAARARTSARSGRETKSFLT